VWSASAISFRRRAGRWQRHRHLLVKTKKVQGLRKYDRMLVGVVHAQPDDRLGRRVWSMTPME
jgi:hypothetical protein